MFKTITTELFSLNYVIISTSKRLTTIEIRRHAADLLIGKECLPNHAKHAATFADASAALI